MSRPSLELVETARLRLVRPTWADYDDLFRMHTDPRVAATLGGVATPELARERMTVHLDHWERHGCGYWIARDKTTDAFLGRGGLRHIELEGRPETEIGYGFIAEAWGRGLATELASETVRIAFDVLGLSELVCFTLPVNRASQRVMEKVGFVYERDGEWANLPHVFYRLRRLDATRVFEGSDPLEDSGRGVTQSPRRIRAVLFDWDGTLSLLREGWTAIMTGQMLETLPDPAAVERIVVGLNGRPTIVQMQAFAAEVERRGGPVQSPADCLAEYQRRLYAMIRGRYDEVRAGIDWAVPGARPLLHHLRSRGLPVILLSGTERSQVRHEAELLGILPLLDELHAPDGDDPAFHKRSVIERILSKRQIEGPELLGFGDGVVETEEVKRVGGLAVAVASETPPARGVHVAKRDRLLQAGADAVIGDYDNFQEWLPRLVAPE